MTYKLIVIFAFLFPTLSQSQEFTSGSCKWILKRYDSAEFDDTQLNIFCICFNKDFKNVGPWDISEEALIYRCAKMSKIELPHPLRGY